jgi:hypothetical protein
VKIKPHTTEKNAVIVTHAEASALRTELAGLLRAREDAGESSDGSALGKLHDLLAANEDFRPRGETPTRVWTLNDADYDEYLRGLPTAEARLFLALRESRYVSYWFPPYSSGASDMIDAWLSELKREWEIPATATVAQGNTVTVIPERGPERVMRVAHVEQYIITLREIPAEGGNPEISVEGEKHD